MKLLTVPYLVKYPLPSGNLIRELAFRIWDDLRGELIGFYRIPDNKQENSALYFITNKNFSKTDEKTKYKFYPDEEVPKHLVVLLIKTLQVINLKKGDIPDDQGYIKILIK